MVEAKQYTHLEGCRQANAPDPRCGCPYEMVPARVIRVRHVAGCQWADAQIPRCDCRAEDVVLRDGQHHCPKCLRPTTGSRGSRLCGPCDGGQGIRAIEI